MSDDKHHSFFPESWEELEKMLRQKAEQTLEGLEQAEAQKLVDAAHIVCPYSNATRGNIDVTLNVIV